MSVKQNPKVNTEVLYAPIPSSGYSGPTGNPAYQTWGGPPPVPPPEPPIGDVPGHRGPLPRGRGPRRPLPRGRLPPLPPVGHEVPPGHEGINVLGNFSTNVLQRNSRGELVPPVPQGPMGPVLNSFESSRDNAFKPGYTEIESVYRGDWPDWFR